jgi:hypothetical protein
MNMYTNLAAANAVSADRFLNSVNMKVGAYTLDETTIPTQGARHINVTHTLGGNVDTLGTLTVVGKDLAGQTITEVITPVDSSLVAGTKWFASVTSVTGAGWVVSVDTTPDTIEIGYGAEICVCEGAGRLAAIVVNTTAASTIVVADARGTIATLKASIGENNYVYGVDTMNLTLDLNGNSDITVIHTPSLPTSYAS